MDAERALRVQTVEVPRIKAIAAREGSILSAAGKGMPYIVNPVALKVFTDIVSHIGAAVDLKDKTKSKARQPEQTTRSSIIAYPLISWVWLRFR